MVSYSPDNIGSVPEPDEVAEQLGSQLAQNENISDDISERVRTSERPLAVPIGEPYSSTGSLRSIVRYCVLKEIQGSDEVIQVSFNKVHDEKWAGITTHPSLLEPSNRLLFRPALAKVYQYGYWPDGWATVVGGRLPDAVDSVAGLPHEQRKLELVWKDDYHKSKFETEEHWFTDEAAVTEFAARVTDDDVSWAQYIPWYQTTAVSAYRLNQVAQTTDWSEFPDRPDARPEIKNRFETSTNPRVGDFIRMAILRKLERYLPTITNVSTGPNPWATDRVALVVDPTEAEGHPDAAMLCPRVALGKLAEYGYRPIDGWYDAPAVGYEPDDPLEPRRIEFARARPLQQWCEDIRMQSPLFNDAARFSETIFLDIDWETFIPCIRSQIISYHQLHDLAQNAETRF